MKEKLIQQLINLLGNRSLITLTSLAMFIFLVVTGAVSADVAMGIIGMVIAFYFGAKSASQLK
jgi:hypothetical protein